jgi:RNA polymerase sigma-70 factor (ECF subfamily)
MTEKKFIEIVPHLRQIALESSRKAGSGPEEAEDIAQEVTVRLWEMAGRLEEISSLDAFTATVARHLSVSSYRKNRKFAGQDAFWKMTDRVAGPDEAMEAKDEGKWLERKLMELPSTEYAILHMRQVERLSNKEIALRLGIAETSVGTLLSRARRRLLEEIRKRR